MLFANERSECAILLNEFPEQETPVRMDEAERSQSPTACFSSLENYELFASNLGTQYFSCAYKNFF